MAEQRAAQRPEAAPEEQRDAQRLAQRIAAWPEREQLDANEDKLTLPPSVKPPDGFVYERKCFSILGKPNLAHWNRQLRAGWRPVEAKRHPEMSPDPDAPNGWILQDGLVLCERPEAYTVRARQEERAAAARQMGIQLERIGHTGDGLAPRVTAKQGDAKLGLKQSYNLQVDPTKIPDPASVDH